MDATTGDWTLDSSRTRLHEYFLHRGIEVEYDMLEIGFPPDRVYQAQLEFEIDGKRYHSFYECDNKKMTQVLFTLRGYWENRRGRSGTRGRERWELSPRPSGWPSALTWTGLNAFRSMNPGSRTGPN